MALLVPCDALACVGCLKNRISELAISAVPLTFETFDPPAAAVYVRRRPPAFPARAADDRPSANALVHPRFDSTSAMIIVGAPPQGGETLSHVGGDPGSRRGARDFL